MTKELFRGNRNRLYPKMKDNSLLVLFSGTDVRKTNDEYYPFYTNQNFFYLTGLDGKELILHNATLHKDAGVLDDEKNIGRYMWHGGAHHVAFSS